MPIDSLYLANLLQVHTPTVQCYTKLCCRVSLRMALKKNVMVVFLCLVVSLYAQLWRSSVLVHLFTHSFFYLDTHKLNISPLWL